MKVLNDAEISNVSGGIYQFIAGYIAGHVLDWTIRRVANGEVDYSSVAEQSGSGYNVTGA